MRFSHAAHVKAWSFSVNLATPSVTPPCLEVTLNEIVLVACTEYFVGKLRLGLECKKCFI